MSRRKILLIEPYYGGSHKQFLEGMTRYVDADFVLLHLPARKWKMRMQLSAPWFVRKIREMPEEKRNFNTVLMSTFIDVAVFRALVTQVRGWNPNVRFCTYFHENQFSYPGILPKTAMHQFTSINFTTALASDRLAFNSNFNRESFLNQCRSYLVKASDMQLLGELDEIEDKSRVLYPGIDFTVLDTMKGSQRQSDKPLIIWNHRWEHDKNPEDFFNILYKLDQEGIPFRVAVLGQSFMDRPAVFEEAEKRLAHVITHFGYIRNKRNYYDILKRGSFIVSTSLHEFFGISILEGIRAGCFPLIPDRLSYPELFNQRFLYRDGELFDVLKDNLIRKPFVTREECMNMTEKFSWPVVATEYLRWLKCGEENTTRNAFCEN